MIQIEDYDLPIQVAEKIISGTSEITASPIDKAICRVFGDTREEIKTIHRDMFSVNEIEEIAKYLLVYCEIHKRENDER